MRGRSNQYSKGPSETNDVPCEDFLSVLQKPVALHKGGASTMVYFLGSTLPNCGTNSTMSPIGDKSLMGIPVGPDCFSDLLAAGFCL